MKTPNPVLEFHPSMTTPLMPLGNRDPHSTFFGPQPVLYPNWVQHGNTQPVIIVADIAEKEVLVEMINRYPALRAGSYTIVATREEARRLWTATDANYIALLEEGTGIEYLRQRLQTRDDQRAELRKLEKAA